MKLVRHGAPGAEKPGLVHPIDMSLRDLSGHIPEIDGKALNPGILATLSRLDPDALPRIPDDIRLGPCVTGIGKLIGVGLNYADHAKESGQPVPEEPILFLKATTSVAGANDPVELPTGATALDWEVELGVVIGTRAKRIDRADALSHVAGYCVVNDLSERNWQFAAGGNWTKGKSHDGFAPIGPWLVTTEEVTDPQALDLWLDIDGQRRQTGSTSAMIFGVAELVYFISHRMTLEPGDVITTGTPPGVGLGMKPPTYLRQGQVMTLGVSSLGQQRQEIV